MTVTELERSAGISRSAASKYRCVFIGEAQAQVGAAAVNAGQVAQ